ncbi:trypsin-like serine peptidase [Rhodopirellula europaea]|uniref:trypsin-like serine peptidase n=1 Tax=Rhodopirellula europaea TaxID=1263866 RepID=UPI003D28DC62
MSDLFNRNLFHAGGPSDDGLTSNEDDQLQALCDPVTSLGEGEGENRPITRTTSDAQILSHRSGDLGSLVDPVAPEMGEEFEDPLASHERDEIEGGGFDRMDEGFEFGQGLPTQERELGRDTRERIPSGSKFYFPVCQILTTFTGTNLETLGTGVLVTPTLVLTAGHNFIKPGRRLTSVRINFLVYSPSGRHFSLGPSQLSRVRVAAGYHGEATAASAAFDYAGIRLPQKVTAFPPLKVMPTNIDPQPGSNVIVAGYPLKANGPANGDHLYASQNKFLGTVPVTPTRRSVSHLVDTSEGESGAPIAHMFTAPSGRKVARVIGIHNKFSGGVNLGTYLRGSVLDEINSWP